MKNTLPLAKLLLLSLGLLALNHSVKAQNTEASAELMQPYFTQNGQTVLLKTYGQPDLQQGNFYQLYVRGKRSQIKRTQCRLVYGQEEQEWILEFKKQQGKTYRLQLPDNLPPGKYVLQLATRNSAFNQYFNLVPEIERKEYRFVIIN